MAKVEKNVSSSMEWMNNRMIAQNNQMVFQDPIVKVAEIINKVKVRRNNLHLTDQLVL